MGAAHLMNCRESQLPMDQQQGNSIPGSYSKAKIPLPRYLCEQGTSVKPQRAVTPWNLNHRS
jgi:hypothetical protein